MKEPETACSSSIRLGVLREVIILLIGRLKNQNCQKRLNKKVVNNIINGHFARVYGQNWAVFELKINFTIKLPMTMAIPCTSVRRGEQEWCNIFLHHLLTVEMDFLFHKVMKRMA